MDNLDKWAAEIVQKLSDKERGYLEAALAMKRIKDKQPCNAPTKPKS